MDAFNGKLTHDGKPVSFPAGEDVSLKVFHEKGTSFGIPIKEDGTFKIGWMPIGKYSGMLNRSTAQQKGCRGNTTCLPLPSKKARRNMSSNWARTTSLDVTSSDFLEISLGAKSGSR